MITVSTMFAFLAIAMLALLATLVIRACEAREFKKHPPVDYSLIASMERPIWGQAFEHAGAPGRGASGVIRSSKPAVTRTDRDHCWMCEDRHQMQSLAAHYRTKHETKENER